MIEHLDHTGAPCTRHPAAEDEAVLALAVIGSRASAFHHDCASKLQSLVLALDELGDLGSGNADMLRAVETATGAVAELNALLNVNRALTKPASRTRVALGQLLTEAGLRMHIVVRGTLPTREVSVAVPAVTHALALLLDLSAGLDGYQRVADLADDGTVLTLRDHGIKVVANAHVLVALAAYVLVREGGELRCGSGGFEIRI